MTIEKDFFRQVMGRFTTGVTVVTTGSKGVPGGLTVNAFCSVSLNPPLILVSVDCASTTLPLLRECQKFAVNILTDKQEHLSRCFATPSKDRFEHFCHAPYHVAATGAPVLDGALAFIDAHVVAEYPGGDHVLFLGQVEALGTAERVVFADDASRVNSTLLTPAAANGNLVEDEGTPLVYYRGQYRHLASNYREPSLTKTYDKDAEEQRSRGR